MITPEEADVDTSRRDAAIFERKRTETVRNEKARLSMDCRETGSGRGVKAGYLLWLIVSLVAPQQWRGFAPQLARSHDQVGTGSQQGCTAGVVERAARDAALHSCNQKNRASKCKRASVERLRSPWAA